MGSDGTETRDHWWWRPGWRPGRSFYTWYFLAEDQPALHEFARRVRPVLDSVAALDPVPVRWLHMTTQGVGFAHEVGEGDLEAIGAAVAEQTAALGPIEVRLGPPVVGTEGVYLPAQPVEALAEARTAVRKGIGRVWGDRVSEAGGGFHPHISLAHANTGGASLDLIRGALQGHHDVVPVTLTRVSLIDLNRDEDMYRWRTVRVLELGS